MLLPALVLLLCLAQQTLQGGVVKPQSVAYGRPLAARGLGVGMKPGVTGALGALGSRYGSKAMKTGIGRYPAAHMGVGGYRGLGLGGRGGFKPAGYGSQGLYGAGLGAGMPLGAGIPNGLGMGLGQGGKRDGHDAIVVKAGYGGGLGSVPGYGAFGGAGYPLARPGVSAPDYGGLDVPSLGQPVPDLMRERGTALGNQFGEKDAKLGLDASGPRRNGVAGPTIPELHSDVEVKNLDPLLQSSGSRPTFPLDNQQKILGVDVSRPPSGMFPEHGLSQRRMTLNPEAVGGGRGQLPGVNDNSRTLGSSVHVNPSTSNTQQRKNCGSPLAEVLGNNRLKVLGSNAQITPGVAHEVPDRTHQPLSAHGQGSRNYLPTLGDKQDPKGLLAKNKNGPKIQGMSSAAAREGEAGHVGVAGEGAKLLSQADSVKRLPKALHVPGQAERNTQAASYFGGAGNYMGAGLGAGGYGAGMGQGAYLGGAAGKLGAAAALGQGGYPQGIGGKGNGYGDGVTGYLGALGGNGFGADAGKTLSAGYGNGYGDGYGAAGLDYPADLAGGAEYKAGKNKALGAGGYAGPVQGTYGALGAGLEAAGGKYGAAGAQAPFGNSPVIPAGLEGDAGYPYAAQQLGLAPDGAKTASRFGAAAGFGAQQAGFAELGVAQDALGQQSGKYSGVTGALGNGYKG